MYQIRSTNWYWDRKQFSSFVEGVRKINQLYEQDFYGTYDLVREGKVVFAFSRSVMGLHYPEKGFSQDAIETFRRRHYK